MAAIVLTLLLLAPYGVICNTVAETFVDDQKFQDITGERLAKIEAVLETVLAKNAELERRVEVLEGENQRLKGALEVGNISRHGPSRVKDY